MSTITMVKRVGALFLTLASMHQSQADSASVQLDGRALISFTTEHIFLQTDRYIYKLGKRELPAGLRVELEKATVQNAVVSVTVPRAAIESLWPATPREPQAGGRHAALAKKPPSDVRASNGRVTLRGANVFSFTEDFSHIEAGGSIYQIRKAALTPELSHYFAKLGMGERVEVTVPQNAVDMSWRYQPAPPRRVAAVAEPDEVTIGDKEVEVRGTVLFSFDDSFALIQSKGAIYQVEKKRVVTDTPKALDNPGSTVVVKAPIEALQFVWSSGGVDMAFNEYGLRHR